MRIERFEPMADENRLRACYDLVVSGQSQDDPGVPAVSFGMFRGWWGYGLAGDPRQLWLATGDAGQPLGCYLLELPERDNRANGFVYPLVGLAARRRGIGTALLAHAARQAGLAGRTLLTEPQIRQIMTFNAVANEHVIAVNDKLAHRVTDYFQSFEIEVAAARKLAAGR